MNIKKIIKKYWWILIFIFVLNIVIFSYLLKPESKKLDRNMEKLVIEYYEEKIKGKVFGIDKQIITLDYLKQAGYDTKKLENCDPNAFAYVIIENPHETDVEKIKYTVENHFNCDSK